MTITEIKAAIAKLQDQITAVLKPAEAAKVDLSPLQNELAGLTTRVDTELTAARNSVTTMEASLATRTGDLAKANARIAELEAANKDLTAKLTDPKGTIQVEAGKKAVETCASLGVNPLPIKAEASASASAESIREQFFKITDPQERAKFYAQHREKLLGT